MSKKSKLMAEGARFPCEQSLNPDYKGIIKFICCDEVGNLTGLSRSTIYRLPDFPQPKRFGASSRWSLQEVLDWIERQPSRTAPAEAEV